MFSGLTSSYKLGTPPGATITLVLVLFLICGLCIQWVWKSIRSNRV
ncbi:hypothetical protein [Bacillus sp. 71mf]|nr:hypothetical protein [Bacillus sp. 71mf]